MTEFSFEHVFRAPSPREVFAAYTDPAHIIEQDKRTEVVSREIIALHDDAVRYHRESRVMPRRQLPAIIRPFISGTLNFHETVSWNRAEDTISIEVRPAIFDGKAKVSSTYRLLQLGPDAVRRVYRGSVTVDVRLIGKRIERGIIEDIEGTLRLARQCTQEWLDRG